VKLECKRTRTFLKLFGLFLTLNNQHNNFTSFYIRGECTCKYN
jgi:hypothetical protein